MIRTLSVFAIGGALFTLVSGCKKSQPVQEANTAPVVQAAPSPSPIEPGMEPENPAEKEGRP